MAVPNVSKVLSFANESSYPFTQGFVITDRYIYLCCIKDNTHEAVYRYDKYTKKLKDRITFTGRIRHGNDFAWNPTLKEVWCAAGGGSREIIVFNEELKYKRTQTVPLKDIVSLAGVAFDPVSGLIAVYGGDSHKIFVLKAITDKTAKYTITHAGKENLQAIAFHDWLLYGIYSSGKIKLMNVAGDNVQNTEIGKSVGECENIKVRNGKIFFNAMQDGRTTLYCSALETITDNLMIL